MVDILGFIGNKLDKAAIPYEYGEWTSTVKYPYFVGSYTETDYRYEDNCTVGTFTLDGWSRNGMIDLITISDNIKGIFADLQEVQEGTLFFIRFGGAMPIPTGEQDLYRIQITLYAYEWKGTGE